jgi:hypothetical protein
MKTATLLLLLCLWSCSFDTSGFMCPQSEPIAPVAFEPVSSGCPEWPVSLDLHECSWDSVVEVDNCSEYGVADCPGWTVKESVSWDSWGTVLSFDASARPASGGKWCDYRVTFEVYHGDS